MGADRNGMEQPPGWDFFDKIYCITLTSRPDRMREAERQFAAVGLDSSVEFLLAEKDHENPERGIYQSHMLCLQRGLEAGARHILIFEDDVFFRRFSHQRLHEACLCLQNADRWNGFFLGCITSGSTRSGHAPLARVEYRCLAHAYALSRPFAEQLVREPWRGIPFDGLLRRCNGPFFALYPMCAFQGLFSSDNGTVVIDRMRNLFGSLSFIQECNEIYQNNKVPIIALHLLVTAVAIAFFTFARQ